MTYILGVVDQLRKHINLHLLSEPGDRLFHPQEQDEFEANVSMDDGTTLIVKWGQRDHEDTMRWTLNLSRRRPSVKPGDGPVRSVVIVYRERDKEPIHALVDGKTRRVRKYIDRQMVIDRAKELLA